MNKSNENAYFEVFEIVEESVVGDGWKKLKDGIAAWWKKNVIDRFWSMVEKMISFFEKRLQKAKFKCSGKLWKALLKMSTDNYETHMKKEKQREMNEDPANTISGEDFVGSAIADIATEASAEVLDATGKKVSNTDYEIIDPEELDKEGDPQVEVSSEEIRSVAAKFFAPIKKWIQKHRNDDRRLMTAADAAEAAGQNTSSVSKKLSGFFGALTSFLNMVLSACSNFLQCVKHIFTKKVA